MDYQMTYLMIQIKHLDNLERKFSHYERRYGFYDDEDDEDFDIDTDIYEDDSDF